MLTLIEDIMIQSETEKHDKNQISEKFFYNVSDSGIKFLQKIVNWKFYNASDFEENLFKKLDFEEKHIFKKHDLEEKHKFKKHDFEEKKLYKKQIF